jgi:exodeoxyribonuclease VII small subunit
MAKKQKFESALEQLESIVEELESGSPDLNKMLRLFEEGMKLTQLCRGHLKEVEDRISTIIKDGKGFIEKSGIDPS